MTPKHNFKISISIVLSFAALLVYFIFGERIYNSGKILLYDTSTIGEIVDIKKEVKKYSSIKHRINFTTLYVTYSFMAGGKKYTHTQKIKGTENLEYKLRKAQKSDTVLMMIYFDSKNPNDCLFQLE